MSTKNKRIIAGVVIGLLAAASIVLAVRNADAASPSEFGLTEGDVIRAQGDLDIYIVNDWGYKRLFVNPAIFNIYGHLGWDKVKNVVPSTRNAFVTSGLFRNCESGDQKVYGLEVVSEDVATLHWVNMTGAAAVAEDANFFNKVFCINNAEQALYGVGTPFTALSQIPAYARGETSVSAGANVVALSASNLPGQTIPASASGVKILSVDFKGNGAVNSLMVKRLGFQPASSYQDIFLYKNGVRVDDPRTFSGTDNTVATFNNLGLTAPFTLDVVVNFNGAVIGSPAQIELQGSYMGLPLRSNQFLFANVAGSAVTFGNVATVDDVVIGQVGAKVGEFKFSVPSGDEDITVKSVQLRNYGSADVSNIRMVIDGVTYPGLALGDDRFLFTTNFVVKDGSSKKVLMYADVNTNADAGDTIKFRLEQSYDVYAVGNVYGFGVSVVGAGTYLDSVSVLSGGSLVASTVTNKPVVALWGDTGISLFNFKLKAEDESFAVSELGFAVNGDFMSKIYVYDGSTLVGSETVDGNVATVSTNFSLTGEKTYTVKADFLSQDAIDSGNFIPKLVAVNATGVGSDDDINWSGSIAGKTVYVYPSVVSVSSSMANGTFTPSSSKKIFSFDLVAHGGDIRLASGSYLATLNVETVSSTTIATTWELKNGSNVVASGSYAGSNTLPVTLDSGIEDIMLADGDSVSLTLYMNTVGFTGTNRYVGTSIENLNGVLGWFGKDSEGDWLSTQFTSFKDTITGLPTSVVEFSE